RQSKGCGWGGVDILAAVGPGASPTPTPTATPSSCSWSAGPSMPTVLVRAVGVYFSADGNFYSVGGRTSDTAGSDFQHVLRYSPGTNSWTQMGVTLPDNTMNNMACGVLSLGGTPYIYCVGGLGAGQASATTRVVYLQPATRPASTLTGADNWPGDSAGTILPGGFAETGNKMYILGGFNINVASTNQIWQFDPNGGVGAKWTPMVNTPEGVMYAPTCAINGIIYVGGASDYQGGTVVDTTNSFSFNPATNTTGAITAIPRATGETRGLAFNGKMLVMGGGRVAPNPSNEVDAYDPVSNTWSVNSPVPMFANARRNFPTDTDGTARIWLAGGYEPSTPAADMEIFAGACPSPTPTATGAPSATPSCTPSAFRVLIAYSDVKVQPVTLHDQIAAEPGVTAVDYFDAEASTPTLGQLQPYNIVVSFSNSTYFDAVAMGNVLADYADGGGIVVAFNFDWYGPPFGLEGRWQTDGYSPFVEGGPTNFVSSCLGSYNAGHPLMQGIPAGSLCAFYRHNLTLTAGAVSVAEYADNLHLCAYQVHNGHTGVGINAYPGDFADTWSGPFGTVVVNAGRWLGT